MSLKVLSYNIWDGGGDRIPAIADVIRAHDPDVVALIEANDPPAASRPGRQPRHGDGAR